MFAQFARWLRPLSDQSAAHRLYIALVAQARQPFFYARWQVPDTVDGRFDLILLHVFLFSHRLRAENDAPFNALATAVTDAFFTDMDRSLREMGVGDMSVGKKIKAMAHALNGRFLAYEGAIDNREALTFALTRNVFGTTKPEVTSVDALVEYVLAAHDGLTKQPAEALASGTIVWPSLN